MDNLKEDTFKSRMIYEGKIINIRVDDVRLPDGNKSTREIVEHNGGVGIIPYQNDEVVLIEQFRKPTEEVLLEIPAGKLEADEDALDCAKRELEEETGYRAGKFEFLTKFYTSPGFSNEVLYLYLATDLTEYEQNMDDGEFIRMKRYDIKDIKRMIEAGEFKDAKTIIGLQYLLQEIGSN